MRLWHYKLLPVLPDKFIIAEWRECIAIKRQWEKGTLKHRLASYVMDYDKSYFLKYVAMILGEMDKKNIHWNPYLYNEIISFCAEYSLKTIFPKYEDIPCYPEHNDRYLKQCYYNLQEKYDRGIITEEEWEKIWHECNEIVRELM